MKVLPFKIPKTERESFRVQIDEVPYLYDTLHNHKEIQITLIIKGEGTSICGDYIGNFNAVELYIIGKNQSHVFRNNKDYYTKEGAGSHAISLFFDKDSFGVHFFELPEVELLQSFLNRTQRGMKFSNKVTNKIKSIILSIEKQKGINRIIQLLKILQILSETKEYIYLSSANEVKNYDDREGRRINEIFQFTMKEYYRDITLEEVSSIANMSKNAFCRFFKQRTRKTYVKFLNEIRISNACKALTNNDLTISQVCYQNGFNNLSNFNRNFKKIQGCSPSQYIRLSATSYQN